MEDVDFLIDAQRLAETYPDNILGKRFLKRFNSKKIPFNVESTIALAKEFIKSIKS